MQRIRSILCSWYKREKCARFPGLSKEEYSLPILIVELKGLGLGQDLNLDSNETRFIIFSQRKENISSVTNNIDTDKKVSISVKVRQFIL